MRERIEKWVRRKLAPLTVALTASLIAPPASAQDLLQRPELKNFVDEMVARHGFSAVELVNLFGQVRLRPDIVQAISNPAEAKPWYQYRPIFLTEDRIRGGVKFWDRHEPALERAEERFGVPVEIIVAIMGVETRYGTYKGKYPVLEALATLAFDYPKRASFFRSELEHYLLLTREEGIDPLAIKGSYAGAMGGPQFIASSYRRYAVDFDGDGQRDLWTDADDMIGSIANYFSTHGWRRGEVIAVPAQTTDNVDEQEMDWGLKPAHTLREIRELGIEPQQAITSDAQATLITLETRDDREHWLGFHNFYVITRYNHSALYAMAVFQLSQAIAEMRRS